MSESEIQEIAREFLEEGFSIVPIKKGSKKPRGEWKHLCQEAMNPEDVAKKFPASASLGVVCGDVSQNLELIDVDYSEYFAPFKKMLEALLPDIQDRIVYSKTPNGFNFCYRCDEPIPGNQKFAMEWVEVEGEGEYEWGGRGEYQAREYQGKWYITPTAIESRGSGGYFLSIPSPGYDILAGEFNDLKPISKSDRDQIVKLARTFDKTPAELQKGAVKEKQPYEDKGKTIPWPSDVFNEDTDYGELLEEAGWSVACKVKGGINYNRPGKKKNDKKGSATLYEDGRLMVFSTSCDPLEENKQYSAFDFMCHTVYDGDYKAAHKAVVGLGYHVKVSAKELKEILEDNPEELEEARKRNVGLTEAQIDKIAIELGLMDGGDEENPVYSRVEIEYDELELRRVIEECDQALVSVPDDKGWGYYKYSDSLGFIRPDNSFQEFDEDTLELRCESSFYLCAWTKAAKGKKSQYQAKKVPFDTLRKLKSYPNTTAPVIKGFAKHPVVLHSGEVIGLKDGFHNQIMFQNCNGFEVDPRPFKECYERIVDLFCEDILFMDKEVGPALFVSMLMTAVSRLGIEGGCPGFFITANEPGTGKSTLFEFVSRIVYGDLISSVDWGDNKDERRKEITSNLKEGLECFLFENIAQGTAVSSPQLAQAITAGKYKSRLLGGNVVKTISAQTMFVFVGNGLNMSTELSRRLMTIELMAPFQNPQERDVKIKNIAKFCSQHRKEVLGCLLKMLQEGAKMKNSLDKSMGFNFWEDLIRNPINSEIGIDIKKGFEASASTSQETNTVGDSLDCMSNIFGLGYNNRFTASDIWYAICDERDIPESKIELTGKIRYGSEDYCEALKDLMLGLNRNATRNAQGAGYAISKLENRVSSKFRLVQGDKRVGGKKQYWLEKVVRK